MNKKMFFSVFIKSLNWETLSKKLVTFKRWDGIKNGKFQYYGGSLKNPIFRGRVSKKGRNCLKGGGGLDSFQI